MKCWRCRSKGIDSTMIREHGYAYCPRCGKETTYLTTAEKKWNRKYQSNSGGCLSKISLILMAVFGILALVTACPWLLLLLLIPLILLAVWAIRQGDDDDDE